MFLLCRLISIAIILVSTMSFAGESSDKLEGWLPVTEQDKQVKDIPGNPGAPAIQLYYSYYKDEDAGFLFVYRRIKILRDSGKKYADAEIEIGPQFSFSRFQTSLRELKARTIHPDGAIVEFKDKVFEKTLYKRRGVKVVAATFTFPEVTVGSIVEYRYALTLPFHLVDQVTEWPIQGDLFTVRGRFRFRAAQTVVNVPTVWESGSAHSQVAYTYLNQVDVTAPQKKKGNLMELEVENVRAFEAEDYMPPEFDYKSVVFFYYGGREIASPDIFWQETGKRWGESAEKFIGNFQEMRDLAGHVIGSETDPEKKLRKLYARAQQVRNLSSERKHNQEETKKEELKTNKTVLDVLKHGFGDEHDIVLFFVALARSAGFDASVLAVSDRSLLSFNKLLLFDGQIGAAAALVKMNGKNLFLEPGTPYCPFGLIQWKHSSASALKLSKSGGELIAIPAAPNSSMSRRANVALTPDGSLKGEINVELNGEDALERRLDALVTDETGRRKNFEEQVKSWLPSGAAVTLRDSKGWGNPDEALSGNFTVEIPAFGSITGKRLIAPAFFFPTLQKNMFVHDGRRYPIVFPYPFAETDEITIKLPQGYSLEVPPYRRKAGLSYAGYEISSSLQGDQLITKRALHFDGVYFEPEEYPGLKGFFNIVQAGDNGQAVLQPQPIANAQQ